MNKEEILNDRNKKTIEIALNKLFKKFSEQEHKISRLNKAVQTLQSKVDLLERKLIEEKLKGIGTGPTSL